MPLPVSPYSIEAEQSVLGGLMLDNSAWCAVAKMLSPQDFYRKDHRLIFAAMQSLARQGSPLDLVTLAEALEKQGKLDEIGGFAYLGVLARDTPSAANVKAYAMIVFERSLDRQRQAAAARHDWAEIERLNHHVTTVKAEQEKRYTPITDTDLLRLEFPSVRWAVPNLVPEGVAILAGSPKIGKSWLALGIAVAVATGGVALGRIQVEPGEVLYLALEDSQRRLQKRLQCVLPPECGSPSGRLHFVTEWPRLHLGGVDRLEAWLINHPEARLVIIDTLEKVRPHTASTARNLYTADYLIGDLLTPLSKKHAVALLIVHHNRKAESEDPVELVSGTLGLTGGVDGVMVLRRKRGQADAFLYVTGKDIEDEKDYAMNWDTKTTTWAIKGDARDYTGSDERLAVEELLKQHGPLSIKEMAERLHPNIE
ncbi:MAG TPA: DnaB-like helicase N-terminal domain-containing protein, partial [Candidatus Competibacteraceae bacterium]|nr:DnaB-like helicase N-terminal domain-containing protein [Candidatus Competibacteraceae bacterium]